MASSQSNKLSKPTIHVLKTDHIHHFSEDETHQISLVLKGHIEVSGPQCDYQTFMWRTCCLLSYEMTMGHQISRNFQYLIASLLYDKLRTSSYLHSMSSEIVGPYVELLCPFEIKGYTEYPIETSVFPNLKITKNHVYRYAVTERLQMRIKVNITLQACKFSDQFRDLARLKGYKPLLPPDNQEHILFLSDLDNLIESSGSYNQRDATALIASDIKAISHENNSETPGFISKIKNLIYKGKKPSDSSVGNISCISIDGMKALTESTLNGSKYYIPTKEISSQIATDGTLVPSNYNFASKRN